VENAGFGAAAAAPIARRVFDYLLLGQYPSEEDIALTQQGLSAAPVGTPRLAVDVPLPSRNNGADDDPEVLAEAEGGKLPAGPTPSLTPSPTPMPMPVPVPAPVLAPVPVSPAPPPTPAAVARVATAPPR